MSSPTESAVSRTPLHTRNIKSQVFERDDGLWDLEATLVDTKHYDFDRQDGSTHHAGFPVHDMQVRVTVDETFTIVDAQVHYSAAPYGPSCAAISADYRGLIGLNLLRGFRHAVRDRFGRTDGCTHMTELCQVLPTLAVQGMGTRMANQRRQRDGVERKPFAVDGCHALRSDGEVVKEYYAKWYKAPTKSD